MHGAVFLRVGSNKICSGFNSGSCSFTKSAYKSLVTTSMFSVGNYFTEPVECLLQ